MIHFVVLVVTVGYASALVCTPELCKGIDRDTPLHCAGSVIKNGGFCGCSDTCAKVEGEACQATNMFGMIPAGRCDDGLECVHLAAEHSRLGLGQCQKKQVSSRSLDVHAQTRCEQMRAVQQISFVIYQGQWMAKCDAMGNFEPQQCDNQNKCFCVDIKTGVLLTERQLGQVFCSGSTSVDTWSSVSSRSLDVHAQTRCEQMRAVQQISFVIYQGQWMAKCDAMGNFEPQQCDNQNKCFCVDIKTGLLLTERQLGQVFCSRSTLVDTSSSDLMLSRDVERHATTVCQQTRAREMTSMIIYDGQWFPNCDLAGNFYARQCDNQHKCFCVDQTSGKLLTERQLGYIDCSTVSGA
ncbi:uncharacterized protein LOC110447855 [Mizuhopecten yessoensis]|uniref:Equistatin n=1 Tax=Mizuhopecten yessoensis TaxID=6573 RepID=A0A210QUE6_MIZYE|nr:uncharacterized protein LOC110447855 [Mizuhopecten yessoensis]OWF52373.1 Equistatin [Mizuhopecten yessoensis]